MRLSVERHSSLRLLTSEDIEHLGEIVNVSVCVAG